MLRYSIYVVIIFILIEFFLRFAGFGYPILYKNRSDNYYPINNQNLKRYKGNEVNINRLGMRTNFEWKNYNNKKKLIFFGDSVSFAGSYIDNKDIFSEKICTKYVMDYVCGNYGVNGYLLENLTNRIEEIKKSNLIYEKLIIVVSNSFNYGKTNFYDLPFYENFNYKFFRSTIEVINHFLFKYKIYDNYHSSNEKKNSINVNKLKKSNSTQLIEFNKVLNDLSLEKDIYIFILPTLENLDGKISANHFLTEINVTSYEVINLIGKLKNIEYQKLYFNNAHLNKKGHDYLAKIIYEYLK